MGKKSWRETLRTIGAKFRSPAVALCGVQGATPTLWIFAPVVRKVSFQDFLLFFATVFPKFGIGTLTGVRLFPYLGTFDQ